MHADQVSCRPLKLVAHWWSSNMDEIRLIGQLVWASRVQHQWLSVGEGKSAALCEKL